MEESIQINIKKQINNCQNLLNITNQLREALLESKTAEIEILIKEKEKALINIKMTDQNIQNIKNQNPSILDNHKEQITSIKNTMEKCKAINNANLNLIANSVKSLNRLKKVITQAKNNLGLVYNKQGQTEIIGDSSENKGVNV